jgi:hypothetical protein
MNEFHPLISTISVLIDFYSSLLQNNDISYAVIYNGIQCNICQKSAFMRFILMEELKTYV